MSNWVGVKHLPVNIWLFWWRWTGSIALDKPWYFQVNLPQNKPRLQFVNWFAGLINWTLSHMGRIPQNLFICVVTRLRFHHVRFVDGRPPVIHFGFSSPWFQSVSKHMPHFLKKAHIHRLWWCYFRDKYGSHTNLSWWYQRWLWSLFDGWSTFTSWTLPNMGFEHLRYLWVFTGLWYFYICIFQKKGDVRRFGYFWGQFVWWD